MGDYAITAKAILELNGERRFDYDSLEFWEALDCRAGPMLPFLVRREWFDRIPFEELNLPRIKAEELSPREGEMWVLFCLWGVDDKGNKDSPFRADGFPLILEWRKGVPDSPLLSAAFHDLAVLVRQQQGVEGWGLCPAYSRYGDNVDFTDSNLFANHTDALYVASAYGAIAAGLVCAVSGKHPSRWPFPTLQWDATHRTIAGVMGLEKKLSVAADCGANVVTVASEQVEKARKTLIALRKGVDGARYQNLRICGVSGRGGPRLTAKRIAYIESKVRRMLRWAVAAALLILTVWGVWIWDVHRVKIECYGDYVERRGLAVGLFPLSAGSSGTKCYRFYYQGYDSLNPFARQRILREVWHGDATGRRRLDTTDVPGHRMSAGKRFAYDEHFRLKETAYLDEQGRLLDISRYSGRGNEVVDVYGVDSNQVAEARELAFKLDGVSTNSPVRRIVYRYDDRGFVRVESYRRDLSGEAVRSGSGIGETHFVRDELGRIKESSYWGVNGEPKSDGHGVHRRCCAYDGMYLRILVCYDIEGRCLEQMEYAKGKRYCLSVWQRDGGKDLHYFDGEGRCVRVEYRDRRGKLVEDDDGVAIVVYEYAEDEHPRERLYDRKEKEVKHAR